MHKLRSEEMKKAVIIMIFIMHACLGGIRSFTKCLQRADKVSYEIRESVKIEPREGVCVCE